MTDVISAAFTAAAHSRAELPPPVSIEIAFAGRSNVGKSSLMNRLLGRRNLVRTSSTPGCTRSINFFEARLRDGAVLHLVDLPGYGYAARSKTERKAWADLIEGYLLERPTLAAVVLLVDPRRGLLPDDLDLLQLLAEPRAQRRRLHVAIVGTKLDKVPRSERARSLASLAGHAEVLGFSTELAETTEAVWRSLRRGVGMSPQKP